MALRLVRGIPKAPERAEERKSRERFLAACLREEANDPKFTEWERGFIASVAGQLDRGRKLSAKQKEILERIWKK